MKKNEYVSPEMEIVKLNVKCSILAGSDFESDKKTGLPFGTSLDDED